MAQINLAPGSQYVLRARRRRRLLYSLTALLAIVSIVGGITLRLLVGNVEQRVLLLTQELQSVETQIATTNEQVEKIELFASRLTSIDQLLRNHRVWSLHLQELERLLPPGTTLTALKASHVSRTLELTGHSPNIDTIAVALATLQNQEPGHVTLFKGGTINNVTQEVQTGPAGEVISQRYSFGMKLTF